MSTNYGPTTAALDMIIGRYASQRNKEYIRLQYGEEIGGLIDTRVKLHGFHYVPLTSMILGRCIVKDVKLPHNVIIVSMQVQDNQSIDKIGRFLYQEDFRIKRGVYVRGHICVEEHTELKCKFIMGYDLIIYGRAHLQDSAWKKTQKYAREMEGERREKRKYTKRKTVTT
jgi:hypothetical protein